MDSVIAELHAHAMAYYMARISGHDFSGAGRELVQATARLRLDGHLSTRQSSPSDQPAESGGSGWPA